MSNYTKQISWSGKDALSDSDSEKVISGGDFDTEFSAVQTAINSKIDTGGVVASDIASNAITDAKVADNALSGDKIDGGTISNFTSTGIDDNATSTAITIDSSENMGIGTTSPSAKLHVYSGTGGKTLVLDNPNNDYAGVEFKSWGTLHGRIKVANDGMHFYSNSGATAKSLQLTTDGRGLSQFTAKAWVNFNGSGTPSIRDSYNVSSITDNATGEWTVNFTAAMNNSNYSVVGSCGLTTINPSNKLVATVPVNTSSCRLEIYNLGDNTHYDAQYISTIVFGD